MFRSSLALLYNDKSVLENHHVSYMFRTMHDFADCNILCNLSRDDFMEFRQLTVDMILATDMSFHFSQLKSMKAAILQPEPIEKTKVTIVSILSPPEITNPIRTSLCACGICMIRLNRAFMKAKQQSSTVYKKGLILWCATTLPGKMIQNYYIPAFTLPSGTTCLYKKTSR